MALGVVGGTTRGCPAADCGKKALRVVEGSKGRMGRCPECGWTGPLQRQQALHQREGLR